MNSSGTPRGTHALSCSLPSASPSAPQSYWPCTPCLLLLPFLLAPPCRPSEVPTPCQLGSLRCTFWHGPVPKDARNGRGACGHSAYRVFGHVLQAPPTSPQHVLSFSVPVHTRISEVPRGEGGFGKEGPHFLESGDPPKPRRRLTDERGRRMKCTLSSCGDIQKGERGKVEPLAQDQTHRSKRSRKGMLPSGVAPSPLSISRVPPPPPAPPPGGTSPLRAPRHGAARVRVPAPTTKTNLANLASLQYCIV